MIIVEKNEGPKIPYTVNAKKTSICFDDDLTINLSKREKDDPVHIDVCADHEGALVIGAAAGRRYVAEIDIPARRYEEQPEPDPTEGEATDDEMDGEGAAPVPIPLDMETVTLSLWAIEEE